jgi:CO/xanthine dehydrogenase FAD-binding subunit
MTSVTRNQPDGLHLSAQSALPQFLEDESLRLFADGLMYSALTHLFDVQHSTFNGSLADALHYVSGPEVYPLLTALLALDAEIHTLVGEERRVLSLPGFLSYRANLPPHKFPLESVRLPPLNPGGRYAFSLLDGESYLATRLDLHQTLRVAGHVRVTLSGPARPPLRLHPIEDRMERQVIEAELIEAAVTKGNEGLTIPLTLSEQAALIEVLKELTV